MFYGRYNRFGGFNVGVYHKVNTVQGATAFPVYFFFFAGDIGIVVVITHAGDFNDVRIHRIDKRTGYHIQFVGFGYRDKGIGFRNAGFFERSQIIAGRLNYHTVQAVRNKAHGFFVAFNDDDVVFFGDQAPGKLNARKPGADNNDFHSTPAFELSLETFRLERPLKDAAAAEVKTTAAAASARVLDTRTAHIRAGGTAPAITNAPSTKNA